MCVCNCSLLFVDYLNSVCATFVLVVIHITVVSEKPYTAHSWLGLPYGVAPAVWKMPSSYWLRMMLKQNEQQNKHCHLCI